MTVISKETIKRFADWITNLAKTDLHVLKSSYAP